MKKSSSKHCSILTYRPTARVITKVPNSIVCTGLILLATGCASQSAISELAKKPPLPEQWQTQAAKTLPDQPQPAIERTTGFASDSQLAVGELTSNQGVADEWQLIVNSELLNKLIRAGLANNYELNASYQNLLVTKEQLNIVDASDFPELSLTINQSRRKSVSAEQASFSNSADLSLQLSYELDIWGKLSAEQRQAQLEYSAAKLDFSQRQNALISQIVSSWYALAQAQTLVNLYQERAANLLNNLDIINASYKLGLTAALDVYLAQNELNSEQARVDAQQQVVLERQRDLELLVANYPKGRLVKNTRFELPTFAKQALSELPASVLTNNFELQSSWLSLLAADAGVAVAHKQRFPSLRLTASGGDISDELGNLLSGNPLAWSISGAITAPLFNAGRLKSLEQQARLQVKAQEQAYLDQVYSKFADIENQISNHTALTKQLNHIQQAKDNAIAAEDLSFDQYLKGLVNYTTVLEAQRRAFDAQTNLVEITHQIIQNRIAMLTSIGGKNIGTLLADGNLSKSNNGAIALVSSTLAETQQVNTDSNRVEKHHDVQ